MLARNDERFRVLVGYEDVWGWTDERGPIPYYLRETWDTMTENERQAVFDDMREKRSL